MVFANELIVGKDHDAVEQKAESRFIERVKEEDSNIDHKDLQYCISGGYWQSEDENSSICISWADILNENILE